MLAHWMYFSEAPCVVESNCEQKIRLVPFTSTIRSVSFIEMWNRCYIEPVDKVIFVNRLHMQRRIY